jgi:alpha-glucosidase
MALATLLRRVVGPALAMTLIGTAPALASQRSWTVGSPDRHLRATVQQPRAGARLKLVVRRSGRRVLTATLGVDTSAGGLARGLSFTRRRDGLIRQRDVAPTGKRRVQRRRARQMALTFARGTRRLQVQVQVSNDGVAYRYRLPGAGALRITREQTAFQAPPGARAWLQRYASNYERPYIPVQLDAAPPGRYAFPVLLQLRAAGSWALLTESNVTSRYPASHVMTGSSRRGELALKLPERSVRVGLPLTTPWRVAVVGGLATVVESVLAQQLGGASQVEDTSWIAPGRVAWSWWSDSSSPRSFERQQQFVDFAARMGWEYVLVDAGWDPRWLPTLVTYARNRAVRILLWARWSDLRTAKQRRRLLTRWKGWGIAGVKLDYVQSDSRRRMAWYDAVARAAAARKLLVDFHGSTLPRGIQRRWPNVMTMEAVLGAEHYKSRGTPLITAPHNATLPFTRNAIGSMDYTPVTFSAVRRETTLAHELALSVVFESGLQHFADSPASYDAQPIAEDFLRQVPVAWDDTRFLAGYPGQSVAIARRRGADWFVGAIGSQRGTTLAVPLGFLARGRSYQATIVTDSGAGLAAEQRTVTRESRLVLSVAPKGGVAVRLAAKSP